MRSSGISTPLSPTSTLSVPPSPDLSAGAVYFTRTHDGKVLSARSPIVSASTVIERIASRAATSTTVFIYDLAEQAGFGTLTQEWARTDSTTAPVVSLQTRAGAGLSLVGRLSQSSSSKAASSNAVLTAYNTPTGLASMMYSLSYLPTPSPNSRLIIHVPTVTPIGETFALSPTLAPLTPVLSLLPEHFTVLLSATSQEAVELAALSYRLTNSHVIHIFDHHGSTREIGHDLAVSLPTAPADSSLEGSLAAIGYKLFDYFGATDAETVFVATNGPLAQALKGIISKVSGLGLVGVRVLRPWKEDALREAIPSSAKTVYVIDDVPAEFAQGSLYLDVFSSLLDPLGGYPVVKSLRITPTRLQSFLTEPTSFNSYIFSLLPTPLTSAALQAPSLKKLLFFSVPKTSLSELPTTVKNTLTSSTLSARHLTDHDAFSKPGGISADKILVIKKEEESDTPLHVAFSENGEADFVSVLDQSLLKTHSIAAHAKRGSPLLVVTEWTPEELFINIHPATLSLIRERQLHLCTINVKEIAEGFIGSNGSKQTKLQIAAAYLTFLRLYLGKVATEGAVYQLALKVLGEAVQGVDLSKLAARTWAGLIEVELPAEESQEVDAKVVPLKVFEFNAIAVDTADGETVVNGAKLGSWHDAAKHIIFPSVFTPSVSSETTEYARDPALRPEVPERTFLVTCTINKRLTPTEYDRNVFHLEFDTRGTGLKYEIGEALGVHGWNDTQDVLDFCQWYGADPDKVITVSIPGGDGTQMHSRTVFQALQQQVDLFGKPGKTFYADLAEYATQKTDQYALRFIASQEGASTFKKLSEKDTVTFADILKKYPSAKPGIERLCEIVGDIKPRHYSIASAQAVVGDRVDLLVVSVDWITPSGSPRYGQCTRYLADLKVGQKVTVSIRPSVMKLPPDNLQPVIMAGLGTGAAPFRAFLQYRALLASQNIPVGPTYYYFGSRHRSQEYLYGEEIEAFLLDGTITHAGLAFSRDQKQKIYIQNKMREDGKDLVRMLLRENGVFYLCGPTWPVPDVYEALVKALGDYEGVEAEKAGSFLEGLKEEERYVLEVY